MAKRVKAKRVEIHPNVYQASEKAFYINVNGVMKYCIKERLDKLLAKAGGDWTRLVEDYRARAKGTKQVVSTKPTTDTPSTPTEPLPDEGVLEEIFD